MKLKKSYLRVVRDLGNWSLEMYLASDWSKDGFSESEYREWLKSVSRFLRVVSKHGPSDLIVR